MFSFRGIGILGGVWGFWGSWGVFIVLFGGICRVLGVKSVGRISKLVVVLGVSGFFFFYVLLGLGRWVRKVLDRDMGFFVVFGVSG